MKLSILTASVAMAFAFSGCVAIDQNFLPVKDKTRDHGLGAKPLSDLVAGIWVDPHGCDHWIIDDGVEGYLSARLNDDGKPVCSGIALPNNVVGEFITPK